MGRPSKFDREKGVELCKLVRAGNFLSTAASFVGVHHATVERWLQRGRNGETPALAQFALDFDRAKAEFEVRAVDHIRTGAKQSKDLQWLLERTRPLQFGERVKVHLQDGMDEIYERLKAGLEPEVFERVIEILCAEAGSGPAESDPRVPPTH